MTGDKHCIEQGCKASRSLCFQSLCIFWMKIHNYYYFFLQIRNEDSKQHFHIWCIHVHFERTFCTKHLEAHSCLPGRALRGPLQSVLTAAAWSPPLPGRQGCTIPAEEQYDVHQEAMKKKKNIHTMQECWFKWGRPVARPWELPVCTSVLQKTSSSVHRPAPRTSGHPFGSRLEGIRSAMKYRMHVNI